MANIEQNRTREFGTSSEKTRRSRQKVKPVRQQTDHNHDPNEIFLAGAEIREPKPPSARDHNDESVDIEDRNCAERAKDERVPFPCFEKVSVKKCDSAAGCAAGDTRMSGQRKKNTVWPGESHRQPSRGERERNQGNAKPHEFVIVLARSEWTANDSHRTINARSVA